MIEPKPLTKERLAEIEADMANVLIEVATWPDTKQSIIVAGIIVVMQRQLRELLGAERFWREVIRNDDNWLDDDNQGAQCHYCCTFHKPDCPWVLAQDK